MFSSDASGMYDKDVLFSEHLEAGLRVLVDIRHNVILTRNTRKYVTHNKDYEVISTTPTHYTFIW